MNELPIFEFRAHGDVWQDKGTPARTDKASGQPSSATPPAYQRPKRHGSQKRRVVEVSGCISPEVFGEVERMRNQWAKQQGKQQALSRSEVVGTLVTRGVQGNTDMQYGSMLEPVIKKIIDRKLDNIANRLAFLSVQTYYAAEETLILQCKILSFILGNSTELLNHYKAEARKEARANLSRYAQER